MSQICDHFLTLFRLLLECALFLAVVLSVAQTVVVLPQISYADSRATHPTNQKRFLVDVLATSLTSLVVSLFALFALLRDNKLAIVVAIVAQLSSVVVGFQWFAQQSKLHACHALLAVSTAAYLSLVVLNTQLLRK